MPPSPDPDDRPEIDTSGGVERGEGRGPVDAPDVEADDVTPGNLGWDEPADEAPQTLDSAVRRARGHQSGEPAGLPSDARRSR